MSATEKAATADERTPVAVQKAPSEAENKAREPTHVRRPYNSWNRHPEHRI